MPDKSSIYAQSIDSYGHNQNQYEGIDEVRQSSSIVEAYSLGSINDKASKGFRL